MTPNEVLAKELETRGLERRSATELWGRSWKAELILSLKTEHEQLSLIHERNLREFPAIAGDLTAEQERAGKLAKIAWEMLRDTREQMMAMALHPTRPKGLQESRGGGRPRKSLGPVEEAEIVTPMPKPEADVPRGTTENP